MECNIKREKCARQTTKKKQTNKRNQPTKRPKQSTSAPMERNGLILTGTRVHHPRNDVLLFVLFLYIKKQPNKTTSSANRALLQHQPSNPMMKSPWNEEEERERFVSRKKGKPRPLNRIKKNCTFMCVLPFFLFCLVRHGHFGGTCYQKDQKCKKNQHDEKNNKRTHHIFCQYGVSVFF